MVRGLLVLLVGGIALRSGEVNACSWSWGAERIAPDGDEHPANAAVVLLGAGLGPEELAATIDGVPVDLVVDESFAEHHVGGLESHYIIMPLRLEPSPQVGQVVAIVGDPCGVDFDCPALDLSYTATEADTTIADVAATLSFDLARFSSNTGNTCTSWASLVSTSVTIDEAAFDGEALVVYEVVARNDDAGLTGTARQQMSWLQFDPYVLFDAVGEAFPLDGWCVDVAMVDAAGNRGTTTTSCMAERCYDGEPIVHVSRIPFAPCDVGGDTSSGSSTGDEPPPSSETSTSDATTGTVNDDTSGVAGPGGTSGASDTSGVPTNDDRTDRGCGCATTAEVPTLAWLLPAALVLPMRRRGRIRG